MVEQFQPPKRKKKKQPYMSAGQMSQMRLQDGMAEIICRHMRAAQLDGLDAMDSWDCEYVRPYYRAIVQDLFTFWRIAPWVVTQGDQEIPILEMSSWIASQDLNLTRYSSRLGDTAPSESSPEPSP